jgi:hypothetical protein
MIRPSKELLSAVLKTEIEDSVTEDNTIWPLEFDSWRKGEMQLRNTKEYFNGINIYELMHIMKEWAFNTGYTVEIKWRHNSHPQEKTRCVIKLGTYGTKGVAGTEFEAVTKACEWILEQRNKEKK